MRWRGITMIALTLCGMSCAPAPRAYLNPDYSPRGFPAVAVVPFDNQSGRREAGRIITSVFVDELFLSKRFQVLEMGNVREMTIQERIRYTKDIDADFLHGVGRRLQVDALVVGSVEEYVESEGGEEDAMPIVALNARMLDTSSGKILWSCHNRRTGNDYIKVLDIGKIRTVLELAHVVVREMVETMIVDSGEVND